MKRKAFVVASLLLTLLLPACNWDTLSSMFEDVESAGSSNTVMLFKGEAPRNVSSTQAIYSDRVVVSFDGVAGADSYDIERVSVGANEETYNPDNWRVIASINADNRERYTYQDETAISPDTIYFYRLAFVWKWRYVC